MDLASRWEMRDERGDAWWFFWWFLLWHTPHRMSGLTTACELRCLMRFGSLQMSLFFLIADAVRLPCVCVEDPVRELVFWIYAWREFECWGLGTCELWLSRSDFDEDWAWGSRWSILHYTTIKRVSGWVYIDLAQREVPADMLSYDETFPDDSTTKKELWPLGLGMRLIDRSIYPSGKSLSSSILTSQADRRAR